MESNNNGGNKFLNGFLLGALIGGGAIFLLSSEKGKKILKILSEEGLDKISDLLQEQENTMEDDLGEDEAFSVNGESEDNTVKEEKKPFVRRFFRGISKRTR
ncbi:MAG: YtxH domain-containing protein [Patescibacteria group bacterium]